MDTLPLGLIAWIYTIVGGIAVVLGIAELKFLHAKGQLRSGFAEASVRNDFILTSVWAMSLLAGVGMIFQRSWAPLLLEYFCWVLMGLIVISSAIRIQHYKSLHEKNPEAGPFPWKPALMGAGLVVIPVVAFAWSTIQTLHNPAVIEKFHAERQARR